MNDEQLERLIQKMERDVERGRLLLEQEKQRSADIAGAIPRQVRAAHPGIREGQHAEAQT